MAQRIRFAAFPNTQPIAVFQTLQLLFGEVRRARPDPKALREFLRLRNLFDKETFPVLCEVIDLRVGAVVESGPFGEKLLAVDDEPSARDVIAARLIELNPLLAKYSLEAMDVEKGGRLHSTNELYRMLTSYVYPGEKPTLGSFKAWVEWASAAGLIKMVGIRWAIGEKGLAALPRLRGIDAEEFLEEERAAAGEPVSQTEPSPEPAAGTAAPVASASGLAPAGTGPEVAPVAVPGPGDGPPPEARPSVPETGRGSAPDSRSVRPPVPSPADRMPAGAAVPRPFRAAAPTADDLFADRAWLQAWYSSWPGRPDGFAAALGIDVAKRSAATPLEAAFAALLLARGMDPAAVRSALDALRSAGVLLAVARGKFPVDVVSALIARAPDPSLVVACEAAVHLPRLLAGTVDLAEAARATDPRELAWALWRRSYEPVAPLAPFHLVQILLEVGLLPERFGALACVPTFVVRENAFRIGFLDRLHATSFAELLDAALALGERFAGPWFQGPLAHAHEGLGCAFRCGRTAACPLACREKGEVAP